MSTYKYADRDGDSLHINARKDRLVIALRGDGDMVFIPNADVPTVALELLKAAGYPALAELVEDAAREAVEKAEAEAAEKKLQERRDALAKDLSGDDVLRYEHIRSSLRKAIDRIILLEDGASRD